MPSQLDQPLSKPAFIATRAVGMFMLAASLACAVVGLVYWHRLSWSYRIILEVIPILFFGTRDDIRQMFISYGRYRREWEEHHRPNTAS